MSGGDVKMGSFCGILIGQGLGRRHRNTKLGEKLTSSLEADIFRRQENRHDGHYTLVGLCPIF